MFFSSTALQKVNVVSALVVLLAMAGLATSAKWYWHRGSQCMDNEGGMICYDRGVSPEDARAMGFDPKAQCCTNPK